MHVGQNLVMVSGSMTDVGCKFCAINNGESEAWIVMEDEQTLAFLDIHPLFPGHVLLVPRLHVSDMLICEPSLAASLMQSAQRLSRAVKSAMEADGIFLAVNNTVSQSVPHLHLHVVPRHFKDGLRGFMWPRRKYGSAQEAVDTARRIRARLEEDNE